MNSALLYSINRPRPDYNKRLQPNVMQLGTTTNISSDYCLVYNYYADEGNPSSCATPAQGVQNDGDVIGTTTS